MVSGAIVHGLKGERSDSLSDRQEIGRTSCPAFAITLSETAGYLEIDSRTSSEQQDNLSNVFQFYFQDLNNVIINLDFRSIYYLLF